MNVATARTGLVLAMVTMLAAACGEVSAGHSTTKIANAELSVVAKEGSCSELSEPVSSPVLVQVDDLTLDCLTAVRLDSVGVFESDNINVSTTDLRMVSEDGEFADYSILPEASNIEVRLLKRKGDGVSYLVVRGASFDGPAMDAFVSALTS